MDERIAELADAQCGVVSLAQLAEIGVGRGAIRVRREHKRLRRVHSSVYAVGHMELSYRGRLWAAMLAGGGQGRVAGGVAAWLHELSTVQPARIEVALAKRRDSTSAVRFVHVAWLDPRDTHDFDDGLR